MSSFLIYEPFYDLERIIEKAFSSASQPGCASRPQSRDTVQKTNAEKASIQSFKPRLDLYEDTERNLVTASFEFPGLSKDDVKLELHNDRLIVSAESKISDEHSEQGYAVRERRYGKFSRTLQLPKGIKEDEIKASMQNGILTTVLRQEPGHAQNLVTDPISPSTSSGWILFCVRSVY